MKHDFIWRKRQSPKKIFSCAFTERFTNTHIVFCKCATQIKVFLIKKNSPWFFYLFIFPTYLLGSWRWDMTRFYKIDQLSKSTRRDGTEKERKRLESNNRLHSQKEMWERMSQRARIRNINTQENWLLNVLNMASVCVHTIWPHSYIS